MDFQALLERASLAQTSKQLQAMPLKYVQLSQGHYSTSALSADSSDIPERIERALAPQSLVDGRLVQLYLPGADIRYMSGLFGSRDCAKFLRLLDLNRMQSGWDRFGKGRSVAQWSHPEGMRYVFSDVEYVAGRFPPFVEQIRREVVRVLEPVYGADKTRFNYCVCNCYSSGSAGVNWHTDSEPHLVPDCPIACVSFGSERVFSLAKIPNSVTADIKAEINIRLQNGSLIVMGGATQKHFFHAIAKETGVREPRFSLTFRVNY
jgi:alkylated DNA repair dioxygenase AlkB